MVAFMEVCSVFENADAGAIRAQPAPEQAAVAAVDVLASRLAILRAIQCFHVLLEQAPRERSWRPNMWSPWRRGRCVQRSHNLFKPYNAGAAGAQLAPEQVAVVAVEVEQGPSNSRRLYAGIDIAAPWDAVWTALTDYDGLADFIPGEPAALFKH